MGLRFACAGAAGLRRDLGYTRLSRSSHVGGGMLHHTWEDGTSDAFRGACCDWLAFPGASFEIRPGAVGCFSGLEQLFVHPRCAG